MLCDIFGKGEKTMSECNPVNVSTQDSLTYKQTVYMGYTAEIMGGLVVDEGRRSKGNFQYLLHRGDKRKIKDKMEY